MYIKSVILLLTYITVSVVSAQHYNVNPCFGRANGFARDLASCAHYWHCNNGQPTRGVCRDNRLFDGESEQCVVREQSRCFQCPRNEPFRLISVPRACPQYIQCFLGSPSLNACPGGLVFDERRTVRNCNVSPSTGTCFRENDITGDPTVPRCPQVTNRPVFIPDKQSCSIYYVCTQTNANPQREECNPNLHFNHRLGICDMPQNAGCDNNPPTPTWTPPTPTWAPPPPTWTPPTPTWAPPPPPTRPPHQGVPALPCPLEGGIFVPDRYDCNVYHACIRGGGTQMLRCPERYYFDMNTRTCRLLRDAVCFSHRNPSNELNNATTVSYVATD